MTLRLFAAISLPDDIRERLAAAQAGLERHRLVPPENFHVTLAFFGAVDTRRAEDIASALSEARAAPFTLWLDGVGVFGGDRARAVYAAVRPDPALTALRKSVRAAARAAGVVLKAERFTPHVTLARGVGGGDLRRWLESRAAFLAGPVPVEGFTLFRSELGRAAPVYTPISHFPIGKSDGSMFQSEENC